MRDAIAAKTQKDKAAAQQLLEKQRDPESPFDAYTQPDARAP